MGSSGRSGGVGGGAEAPLSLIAPAASTVPLTLKTAASPTGDFWQAQDSGSSVLARLTAKGDLRFSTNEPTIWMLGNWDQAWTNGPVGETNYTDHVGVFGYNIGETGARIDVTQPACWLQFEHRFYQTFDSGPAFGCEAHFNMMRPGSVGSFRPWGASMNLVTNEISTGVQGNVAWQNAGGTVTWMQLHENNKLLTLASDFSFNLTPSATTRATVFIGEGPMTSGASILVFGGATQTVDLLSIRTPDNISRLQVLATGEVKISKALIANFSQDDGAIITVQPRTNSDGVLSARRRNGQTGDLLTFWTHDQSALLWAVNKDGKMKWDASNVQATVGGAGAASALPATPSKYLKVIGDDGATYVVPAYAP